MEPKPRKLTIFVCTPTFLPIVGGAEMGIHEIYKRLGKRHNVSIITPKLSSDLLKNYGAEDHTDQSYKVHRFDNKFDLTRFSLVNKIVNISAINYYRTLYAECKKQHPDVINFHFIVPHGLSLVGIKKFWGLPIALSLVGRSDVFDSMNIPFKWYSKFVMHHADILLPNSRFYLGSNQSKMPVRLIPYGVDITLFHPSRASKSLRRALRIGDNQIMLLTVSRLAPIKRVDVLIEVMRQIIKINKDVVLVIGGKGEEYDTLKKLVHTSSLTENVKLVGYIAEEDLPQYYASSDIFVFHSQFETFGIVFAQAMASGLPIVAAETSCVPDVVPNGTNGILVKPFDIAAFCDAILHLANDKNARLAMGERNRKHAEKAFYWDNIAKEYEEVMLSLEKKKHDQ